MPEIKAPEGVVFTLKDLTYSPEQPREKEPFTVKGKIELFKIPFVTPIWVQAKVTYPERWWEEVIPIIGSPTVAEGATVFGGNFEIKFPKGFDREGEFILEVSVYLGPTYSIDSIVLPPFPPVVSEKTTFIVAGEVPEEELGFRNFRVISYSKNGGTPVTPPGVLELEVGDRCRIKLGFEHTGLAVTGEMHAAIWQDTFVDPHDEVLSKEKSFGVPASDGWEPHEESIDIIITSKIAPGTEYGLYAKIMGITGGDIFTGYLENVITIIGPPPEADIKDFDFKLTKGTYNIGDKVSFTAPYGYKGIAQDGQITISIGTGAAPSFFTKHTFSPVSVRFDEAADWATRGLEGSIVLPAILEPGQMYSVRAKLETLEKKTQETDTDFSAFDIEAPVEERWAIIEERTTGGHITTRPLPTHKDGEKWYYPYGEVVTLIAVADSGYAWVKWEGEVDDVNVNPTQMVMTQNRGDWYKKIRAEFKKGLEPPKVDTLSAKNITHNSATLGGKLIDTGYWSNVDVFFEINGEITSKKLRMYEGNEGEDFYFDVESLEPGTDYRYRAAVDAVGGRSEEVETGYGSYKTFSTKSEVVKGFTMKVRNAPAGALYWRALEIADYGTGDPDHPAMPNVIPLHGRWDWPYSAPSASIQFGITAYGPSPDGYFYPSVQYDEIPIRLRDGKEYLWDFGEHSLYENGFKVFPPY